MHRYRNEGAFYVPRPKEQPKEVSQPSDGGSDANLNTQPSPQPRTESPSAATKSPVSYKSPNRSPIRLNVLSDLKSQEQKADSEPKADSSEPKDEQVASMHVDEPIVADSKSDTSNCDTSSPFTAASPQQSVEQPTADQQAIDRSADQLATEQPASSEQTEVGQTSPADGSAKVIDQSPVTDNVSDEGKQPENAGQAAESEATTAAAVAEQQTRSSDRPASDHNQISNSSRRQNSNRPFGRHPYDEPHPTREEFKDSNQLNEESSKRLESVLTLKLLPNQSISHYSLNATKPSSVCVNLMNSASPPRCIYVNATRSCIYHSKVSVCICILLKPLVNALKEGIVLMNLFVYFYIIRIIADSRRRTLSGLNTHETQASAMLAARRSACA